MMRRSICLALLACIAAHAQNPNTAAYPSALATDTTITVASDRARTTLSVPMGAGDTSFTLINGTAFVVPMVVTIEDERIKVCSKVGSVMTVCSSGRGWAGSTAASHSAGVAVTGNLVAHHINQLAAEVKAIETALGTGVAPTQDATLVGDGSKFVPTVLPSCSSGATDKLLYNSSTNAFSCGTDQSGGGMADPGSNGIMSRTALNVSVARTITGTANQITVTAAAGTLTGATLAAGVTASSLTSVGTIATGVWQGTAIGAAYMTTMVGDSGSGGVKGAAPAPGAGDAAAGKYLKADGTWAVPAGGSGTVTSVGCRCGYLDRDLGCDKQHMEPSGGNLVRMDPYSNNLDHMELA